MLGIRATLVLFAATVAAAPAAAQGRVSRAIASLHPGQQWHYRTRPGEEASTVLILRIDTLPKVGVVVHIAVQNAHIRNPRAPDGYNTTLPHAPMSEVTLRASLTTLVAEAVSLPDFRAGYDDWQRAHGGAWSVSVAEMLTMVERTLAGS